MSGCAHRWRIAEPDGRRELPGTCQRCGATATFVASSDHYSGDWQAQSAHRYSDRHQLFLRDEAPNRGTPWA